jgi:hypothetical protein
MVAAEREQMEKEAQLAIENGGKGPTGKTTKSNFFAKHGLNNNQNNHNNIAGNSPPNRTFFEDAVAPLRDAAVEIAQLAYTLLRRDEPALSRAPNQWSMPVSATNNNRGDFFEENQPPLRGNTDAFRGLVHSWEQPTVRPGEVALGLNNASPSGALARRQQQLQSDSLLDQIDRSLREKERRQQQIGSDFGGENDDDDRYGARDNNNPEASIHPLTNWVRYSPDIPVQARDDLKKPVVPRGIAVAPTFNYNGTANVNPSSTSGGMRGGDLKGIANFRKSLIAQHGHKEGSMRFELWLGSQNSQWTTRFHAELERRDMKFSEWLASGEESLTK